MIIKIDKIKLKFFILVIFFILITGIISADNQSNGTFKIQPTIKYITLSDKINKDTDGLINIYAENPIENNYTISVDLDVKANPNIYFFSSIFPSNKSKGIANGFFTVQAGRKRMVNITLRSDEAGEYKVEIDGKYYIVGQPNSQTTSYTQIFKVIEPSGNLNNNNSFSNLDQTNNNISETAISETATQTITIKQTIKQTPNINIVFVFGILILILVIKRKSF